MKEDFYKSTQLTDEQLKKLMSRSDQPALLRFALMYVLLIGTSVAVVFSWGNGVWWQIVLTQFVFGLLCCSLFACEHEMVHATAFKSRRLNKIAAFLCGLPHLYAPAMFKEFHFTHHRHTHEPGLDPEISFGGKAIPSVVSNLPMYLSWLTGFPLMMGKVAMLVAGLLGMPAFVRKNAFPFVREGVRYKIMLQSWIILLFHLSIAGLAIYVYHGFWGLFVGQVVGHCLLASYLAMEHNGLPHEGTILEKTRSIQTNNFVRLLMWNMPYHAEHHAFPAVPFHALPQLSEEMQDELIHKEENHPTFHLKTLKNTIVGQGK